MKFVPFVQTSVNTRQIQRVTTKCPVTTTCFGTYQAILKLYRIICWSRWT